MNKYCTGPHAEDENPVEKPKEIRFYNIVMAFQNFE